MERKKISILEYSRLLDFWKPENTERMPKKRLRIRSNKKENIKYQKFI